MAAERAINLSFSDASKVLMSAFGFEVAARPAFEARMKQLQRHGLLGGGGDKGTRQRIEWGVPELAALAVAFKLMGAFMTPTLAARYAAERMTDLAPFLLAGAASVLPPGYAEQRPITGGCIAVFEGTALRDLGLKRQNEVPYTGPLGRIAFFGDADAIGQAVAIGGGGIVIDSRAFMPAVVSGATQSGLATEAELAFELDRLRYLA